MSYSLFPAELKDRSLEMIISSDKNVMFCGGYEKGWGISDWKSPIPMLYALCRAEASA